MSGSCGWNFASENARQKPLHNDATTGVVDGVNASSATIDARNVSFPNNAQLPSV